MDRLAVAEGDTVELDKVLFIADENQQIVGRPTIEGAKVVATVGGEGKGKKIIVFKYKSKTRSRVKTGHRQMLTRPCLLINNQSGMEEETPKRIRRTKKEVVEDGA